MSLQRPEREKVQRWNEILKPYQRADTRKSILQLVSTIVPLLLLWYLALRSLEIG